MKISILYWRDRLLQRENVNDINGGTRLQRCTSTYLQIFPQNVIVMNMHPDPGSAAVACEIGTLGTIACISNHTTRIFIIVDAFRKHVYVIYIYIHTTFLSPPALARLRKKTNPQDQRYCQSKCLYSFDRQTCEKVLYQTTRRGRHFGEQKINLPLSSLTFSRSYFECKIS